MSLRSRLLRIALVLLAVLLFAGYFAFSTFLFNPLEGDLEADVAALAPRDVDFFVARADLRDAFDPFPELAAYPRLAKHPAWQAFEGSPEYAGLRRDLKIDETLKQVREATARLPLGLEPLEVFGGRDLAVAGYFRGADLAQADWAAYGRANWAGKLAAEALRYPSLIGLSDQGIQADVQEGWVSLRGGALARQVFVGRIQDVVVVATQKELVEAAHGLVREAFADSLYQSAPYNDHILNANREPERDEVELYVNTRKLLEQTRFRGPWPDTKSQDFGPAFLGRLFQLGSLKAAMGVVGVDEGVSLDLRGDLSSELVTPDQARVYRTRGFDRDQFLFDVARLAPADTALFLYAHAPLGDVLRMALASAEPALKQNLEDAFRNTGKYQSLDQLITQLDGALKDRFAVIVRANDYPPDPDGPKHNDDPVPAVMLVLWTKDVEPIHQLRELIGNQGAKFGLQGRTPTEPGFFKHTEAGFETREYWSQLIPGTGIVVTGDRGELTIVTNALGMLGHIAKTYDVGGERYPRLADDSRFQALVGTGLKTANLALWANPKSLGPILRSRVQRVAEDSIVIDWPSERARVEDEVIRATLPGKQRGRLSAEEQAQVDAQVDPKLDALQKKVRSEQIPARMAEEERKIRYLEALTAVLAQVALDPRSLDVALRATMPLPER